MKYEEIKKYWEVRGNNYKNKTTDDVYLREIEIKSLKDILKKLLSYKKGFKIADFGCGDGYSTLNLANFFPEFYFYGFDYSSSMIKSAEKNKTELGFKNIEFLTHDILKDDTENKFDLIYTDRCLINFPNWEEQKKVIFKIFDSLNKNGYYVMIENFIEGHENFNNLRRQFGLDEIVIREHNCFFEKEKLISFMEEFSEITEISNISSIYYIVSRIIYSKICALEEVKPDYLDIHHKLSAELPYLGDFGPVSMIVFKKR